jgi:excisionase family DNA binding protein
MAHNYLSTYDVAKILSVNESSIKRWANNGVLKCFRTPGGHRKFRFGDVIEFSEKFPLETSADVSALNKPDDTTRHNVELSIASKNFESLSIFLESLIDKKDIDGAFGFLKILYINKLSLADIFDYVVSPVLEHTHFLCKEGKLGINEEHLSTEIIRRVLNRLLENIHIKEPNGLTAICGCLEREHQDLEINCVRFCLEADGWLVYYFGANLPVNGYLNAVKLYKPDIVCISIPSAGNKKFIRTALNKLHPQVKSNGGRLLLAGAAAIDNSRSGFNCDFAASSLNNLLNFIHTKSENDKGK